MKRFLLFFLCVTLVFPLFAQGVNISYTSGTYSTSSTVSFTVSWASASRGDKGNGKIYQSKVWMLIDYKDNDGSWKRASIASLNNATQGTLSFEDNNRSGFWLDGGTGNVSSKVTVTLNNLPSKFSWCAYVSDRPAQVSNTTGSVTFKGSLPFYLTYTNGTSGTATGKNYTLDAEKTLLAFTDATSCPGGIANYGGLCYYAPSSSTSTFASATFTNSMGITRQRYSLIDERDGKIYQVVKMPDGKWWMAQNLDYRTDLIKGSGATDLGGGKGTAGIGVYYCYNDNTVACDNYGALYTWEAMMMVDGKWNSDAKSSSVWNETTSYCTGASNSANCQLSHAKGSTQRGICPPNWHVPTDYEWAYMASFVDPVGPTMYTSSNWGLRGTNNTSGAGAQLKSTCSDSPGFPGGSPSVTNNNWPYSASYLGLDTYGFRALSAGQRNAGTGYAHLGIFAFFWSSSAYSGTYAAGWYFNYNYSQIRRSYDVRSFGFPVRCVRD